MSGIEAGTGGGVVLAGPGAVPVRGPGRVNNVLTAVREMVVHAVANGAAPGSLLPVLFEVADDRDLPAAVRGDQGRMGGRMRARHRLAEPDRAGGRAKRMAVPAAAASDFVLVNLRRGRIGGPMRPDAVNEVLAAASARAGLGQAVVPHSLRHAFGSSLADAEVGMDVIQELMGHRSITSTQVYVHPDEARLRAAVDLVPGPREQFGTGR